MDPNAAYRFVAVLQDEVYEVLREAAETSLRAQHVRWVAEQTRQCAASTRQRAAAILHDSAT